MLLLCLLFSRLNMTNFLSLSLKGKWSRSLTFITLCWPLSSFYTPLQNWRTQGYKYSQYCLIIIQHKGIITSLDLLAPVLAIWPSIGFVSFAMRAHCWLMLSLVTNVILRNFSAGLVLPVCTDTWGYPATSAGLRTSCWMSWILCCLSPQVSQGPSGVNLYWLAC